MATGTSVEELRTLRFKFDCHAQSFRDWARAGGPINPTWAKETADLKRELHLAQCRAAARIFASSHEEGPGRCLGAFLVHRRQRAWARHAVLDDRDYRARHLEELAACNAVGTFERFGDRDIAFVCHFCDGHIVWEDLQAMPSLRRGQDTAASSPVSPVSPGGSTANWQAAGVSVRDNAETTVVFAPVAIANHVPPMFNTVGFLARLLCPYCEDDSGALPSDPRLPRMHGADGADGDDERERAVPDEFEDLAEFQEHLEWQHTAAQLPVALPIPSAPKQCAVM